MLLTTLEIPGNTRHLESKMTRWKLEQAWARALSGVTLCCLLASALQADSLDNWSHRGSFSNVYLFGTIYGRGLFVAVGGEFMTDGSSRGAILTSADGTSWVPRASGVLDDLRSVTYNNEIFVTVGYLGRILTSTDGIAWANRNSGSFYSLNGITFGGGKFVAVGEGACIQNSADGINWNRQNLGTFNLLGICHGNGLFVAVGKFGTILISADGINWNRSESGTRSDLFGVAFGKGTFVAVGPFDGSTLRGSILASTDGIHWTSRVVTTNQYLFGVAYGSGIFTAVGDLRSVFTSLDGINWSKRQAVNGEFLNAVTYGNATFVAVGDQNIMQSDVLVGLALRRSTFAELIITGPVGRSHRIEVADGLQPADSWRPLATVTASTSPYSWIDGQSISVAPRFYRTVLLP